MSTSKENYDHLVFLDGNYGIDIAKGIWPGSGQAPGIKGDKGDPGYGEKGQKGGKGQPGVNGSNGSQGPVGAKGDPGPEGPKGIKGNGGPSGNTGQKGQKGQQGAGDKGDKGDMADAPVFIFKGQVLTFNDLPATGNNVGDVYQTLDNDYLYAWDGSDWVTIAEAIGVVKGEKGEDGDKGNGGAPGAKGQKGQTGDKGVGGGQGFKGQKGEEAEKGEKGEKGVKGEPGQDGTDGTDGTKGGKGQKGENVDYSLVYTKTQTDSLIEDFRPPQFAFDIDAYSLVGDPAVNPNKIIGGAIDFDSPNQNNTIYNSGIVTINSAVTVDNSPIAASDLMIVNYVAAGGPANAGDVRDVDYKLLQYVFALNENDGAELGYWRFVEPGGGLFGDWNLSQFDSSNYYTKAEVNNLDREYTVSTAPGADGTKTKLVLTDDNGTTSDVNINVSGGLSAISSDNNTITIDASAISGNVTFEGGIDAGDPTANPPIVAQDPATLDPAPNGGDYFIFTNAGTAWNGDAVTEGDWAIYNASEDPGVWITLDYQTSTIGVASVDVTGGILSETGTASDPVISLTTADLEAALPGYVTNPQLGSSITGLEIGDLSDVDIYGAATFTPSTLAFAQYNDQIADNTQPAGDGQYSVIPELNTIWMMQNSVNSPGQLLINTMLSTANPGDKFIIKATNGDWQQLVTFVSYQVIGGTRKFVIEEASGVGAVNGYTGTWAIRGQVATLGINNNQILRYNSTSSRWELSSAYTTSAADTEFLSKTQGGTVQEKVIIARNGQSAASNSFILQGRTSANGSVTSALFKTYINTSSNTSKDWVQYFGETDTQDTQIQTRGSVNTKLLGYVPLTGDSIITGITLFKRPSSGNENAVVQVQDQNGSSAVKLYSGGGIEMGTTFNLGYTGTAKQVKIICAQQLANTYLDIFTTNAAGDFYNGNTYGTLRVGAPNGGDNLLQVFTPGSSGGSAVQSLVVKSNGQVTVQNQGSTINSTNMTDASVVTKRQLVAEINSLPDTSVPVGTIVATLSGSAPTGWFLLNGTGYSTTTYPQLDAILKTTAGHITGVLPDFRGQHLVMKGGNNFNNTIGTKYSSRTKMPAIPFGMLTAGAHTHTYGSDKRYGGGTTRSSYDADPRTDYSYTTSNNGGHVHTITGGDNETNPPCAVINWMIKHD